MEHINRMPTKEDFNRLVDEVREQKLTQAPIGWDIKQTPGGIAMLGGAGGDYDGYVCSDISWNATLHRLDITYQLVHFKNGWMKPLGNSLATHIDFAECEVPA